MIALPWCELVGVPARTIRRVQGRSEAIEHGNGIGGQSLEFD
jgi:hypothetical protein